MICGAFSVKAVNFINVQFPLGSLLAGSNLNKLQGNKLKKHSSAVDFPLMNAVSTPSLSSIVSNNNKERFGLSMSILSDF